jgi:hypothetical protein
LSAELLDPGFVMLRHGFGEVSPKSEESHSRVFDAIQ